MNPVVAIDLDQASANIDVVIDVALQNGGGIQYATIGGRYDLGFDRIDGSWRIARRSLHRKYVHGDFEVEDLL